MVVFQDGDLWCTTGIGAGSAVVNNLGINVSDMVRKFG